jgi:CheY-like chemotaxis protein
MSTNGTLHEPTTHVLVVDDDMALRRMVAMVLEDAEWEVLEARDGREALSTMRSNPDHLIVLLDWKMPNMSGEDVLNAVKADPDLATRHAYILITAMSAMLSPHVMTLLNELSVPVIAKPFGIQQLLCVVEDKARNMRAKEAASQ